MHSECPMCHGSGEVHDNPSPIRDPQCEVSGTCPLCYGEGEVEMEVIEPIGKYVDELGEDTIFMLCRDCQFLYERPRRTGGETLPSLCRWCDHVELTEIKLVAYPMLPERD